MINLRYSIAVAVVILGPVAAVAFEGASVDHLDYRTHYGLDPSETVTFPEVGVVTTARGGCIGTAIAPNAVLTSYVCVGRPSGGDLRTEFNVFETVLFKTGSGKWRLRCVPVGGPELTLESLALCRTAGGSQLGFAVLSDVSERAKLEVNFVGRGCGKSTLEISSRFGEIERVINSDDDIPVLSKIRWLAPRIQTCAGDQGTPAFWLSDDPKERRRLLGVVVGTGRSGMILASTEMPGQGFEAAISRAAEELDLRICNVNLHDERFCTQRPIPEDPVPPDAQTNLFLGETIAVSNAADETLLDLVDRACKFVTPDHLKLLQASLGADYLSRLMQPIGQSGTQSLPDCPNVTRIDQRVIIAGDAASKYFSRDPRHLGFSTLGPLDGSDLSSFMGVFWRLNPQYQGTLLRGATVNIPVIEMAADSGPVTTESAERSVALGRAVLLASVMPGSDGFDCSIPPPPDAMHYPFDVPALLEALYLNQQIRTSDADIANVLIADTGIFLRKGDSGNQEYFDLRNPDDPEVAPLVLNTYDATHGTQVASVALGGPFFARLWSLAETRRIQIRSLRIFGYNEDFQDFSTQVDAIRHSVEAATQIVNFSLTGRDGALFDSILGARNRDWPLFVVAAGNNAGNTAEDFSLSFPGDFGGDGWRNLISVANLDGTQLKLHPTSSFHPSHVDIAAPGCQIPVIGWKSDRYILDHASGTSLAAPLVSFAAALIYGEGRDTSAQKIKRRLMISADLSPSGVPEAIDVSNTVRDGRRLNIVKAVSLHEDLIEVPNDFGEAGSQLLRGKVSFLLDGLDDPDKPIPFLDCGSDGSTFIPPKRIYKIWPFVEDNKKLWRIYYRQRDAEPQREDPLFLAVSCAVPEGLKLEISERDEVRDIQFDELIDFVKSSK